jgi:hypothetical protein
VVRCGLDDDRRLPAAALLRRGRRPASTPEGRQGPGDSERILAEPWDRARCQAHDAGNICATLSGGKLVCSWGTYNAEPIIR